MKYRNKPDIIWIKSEEQISFPREQLRNKDKMINSLVNQLSKISEVIQTPVINPQDKNLFLKITRKYDTSKTETFT